MGEVPLNVNPIEPARRVVYEHEFFCVGCKNAHNFPLPGPIYFCFFLVAGIVTSFYKNQIICLSTQYTVSVSSYKSYIQNHEFLG